MRRQSNNGGLLLGYIRADRHPHSSLWTSLPRVFPDGMHAFPSHCPSVGDSDSLPVLTQNISGRPRGAKVVRPYWSLWWLIMQSCCTLRAHGTRQTWAALLSCAESWYGGERVRNPLGPQPWGSEALSVAWNRRSIRENGLHYEPVLESPK